MRNQEHRSRRRGRRGKSDDFLAALDGEEIVERNPKHDHKTMQLCAQVRQALSLALSGECHDDLLRELYVDAVIPAPNAARLLVRLIVPARVQFDLIDLHQRLSRVGPYLRTIVAKEISRKRAPELTFVPAPESEVQP